MVIAFAILQCYSLYSIYDIQINFLFASTGVRSGVVDSIDLLGKYFKMLTVLVTLNREVLFFYLL